MTAPGDPTVYLWTETTEAEQEREREYSRIIQFLNFVQVLRSSTDVLGTLEDYVKNMEKFEALAPKNEVVPNPVISPSVMNEFCFSRVEWFDGIEEALELSGWKHVTPKVYPCVHLVDDVWTRTTEGGVCEHVEHGNVHNMGDVAIINAKDNDSKSKILYFIRMVHTLHANGLNRPKKFNSKVAHLINLTCHNFDHHLMVDTKFADDIIEPESSNWGEALTKRLRTLGYTELYADDFENPGDDHYGEMFNGLLLREDLIKLAFAIDGVLAMYYSDEHRAVLFEFASEVFIISFGAEGIFESVFESGGNL